MNTTAPLPTVSRPPFAYIGHILYIGQGSCMVIANSLIVITLLCHRSLHSQQMHTVVALAISDGLYGVGILTGGIRRLQLVATHTDRAPMSAWMCLKEPPTIFLIAGSQMTALAMLVMSVDRYIVVHHLFWYLQLDRRQHAGAIILTVVGFGVATSTLAVASCYWSWGDDTHAVRWSALCLSTWAAPGWYATGYTVFVAVGGYASIVIYALVLIGYRRYARETPFIAGQTADNNLAEIKMQIQHRLTITMAFVTLMTFVFHSLPYNVIIVTTLGRWRNQLTEVLNELMWCMVCVNSLVNIFIYLRRHADIRLAMADVLHGRLGHTAHFVSGTTPLMPRASNYRLERITTV